ncbi:creatininase family protein [Verminephrobacter aporrectodeae subsp. tuberculatae]|uniref:Creatininase family protein n=1 Tax=Verminephrobacter aporrectodeae subsp. tuberculatae TaxID=1110392 RepID=A0ABT3KYE9_9BURK|nr:creatininase family protein [Verminephrobacter aporrectodeae]MCW5256283.1 creatininase family protein [Verminephrobacter aporrectodeae subsp. tuberculatae]MCW5323358.1 creatininase family protein [Verminephrobacter aporrectodeae subsp. tuberculatae]
MRIRDCNWMQIETYLQRDDRVVLPIGSTEQHAYLSLCTDAILAEQVAVDAAQAIGVPVYPALPFGLSPYFMAFPGTVSLRVESYLALIQDMLDSVAAHGFRRILIVNGHGGNQPAASLAMQWMARNMQVRVKFHNWWNAPKTWAKVREIDPVASHASWMENFSHTRIAGVGQPQHQRPMIDLERLRQMHPGEVRRYLGDGNYGGHYHKPEDVMQALWQVAVSETAEVLDGPWL